jgi:hypothetical protein
MARTSPTCRMSETYALDAFDKFYEINPDDIQEGWLSVTIKRLAKEMNRQIAAMESVKYDAATNQPPLADRAENANTLVKLQKTAAELAKMEERRDARISKKNQGRSHDDLRAAYQSSILTSVASGRTEESD